MMPFRLVCTAIVLSLGTLACSGSWSFEDLDWSIDHALSDLTIAGMAVAIVKDGKVVHLKGYGYRDIRNRLPVDGSTIFGLGSTSKAFGAAAIGVLVHEGKLDWDDRVIDHLPDFQVTDKYVTHELTVRDLLCHRSGVERNNIIFFSSLSRDEIVGKARLLRQVESFRSRFGYHNLMFLTAGQVAARVAGRPWDDIVREEIFQPLGMSRSCTSIGDLDSFTNVATPHIVSHGKLVTVPWLNVDSTGPAGCVNSCAADMARWLQVHLNEGVFEGKEIWGAEVQRTMHAPHTIMSSQVAGGLAKHSHFGLYGLGWMMHDYRGRKVIHHGGATDGMGSFVGLVPEEGLGVVVLQNTSQSQLPSLLGYRIIDALLGAPEHEWPELQAMGSPTRTPEQGSAGTPPSLPLARYTGVYRHPMYEHVTVELKRGSLVLGFDLYPDATLEHREKDTFTMRFDQSFSSMWDRVFGPQLEVSFKLSDAEVSEMSIQHFGIFTSLQGSPSAVN